MCIQNLSIVITTFFNRTIQEVVVSEKNKLKTFSQKNPMVMFVMWLVPSCRYI